MNRIVTLLLLLTACGGKSKPAAPEPPVTATPIAAVTGVAACDEYIAKLYAFAQCPGAAPDRDSAMLAIQVMVTSPDQIVGTSDEEHAEADEACGVAIDEIAKQAETLGCELAIPTTDYVADIRVVDEFSRCDKVPQDARDEAKAGLAAMQAGLADFESMTDAQRTAADDDCLHGYNATQTKIAEMGCP